MTQTPSDKFDDKIEASKDHMCTLLKTPVVYHYSLKILYKKKNYHGCQLTLY